MMVMIRSVQTNHQSLIDDLLQSADELESAIGDLGAETQHQIQQLQEQFKEKSAAMAKTVEEKRTAARVLLEHFGIDAAPKVEHHAHFIINRAAERLRRVNSSPNTPGFTAEVTKACKELDTGITVDGVFRFLRDNGYSDMPNNARIRIATVLRRLMERDMLTMRAEPVSPKTYDYASEHQGKGLSTP